MLSANFAQREGRPVFEGFVVTIPNADGGWQQLRLFWGKVAELTCPSLFKPV